MAYGGRSRRRRAGSAAITAIGAVFLVTQNALAAVTWTPPAGVGPFHSFNGEQSLARTSTSSSVYLHSVYTTDFPGGVEATDTGPYVGVYYRRGTSATTWGTAKRLNPAGQHAFSSGIVSSGKVLYAAYVTLGHWNDYDPAEGRSIAVRINSNHGDPTAWLTKILDLGERVDRASLAPWGSAGVAIAYTEADTGDIILVTCGNLTFDVGCSGAVMGTTTRDAFDPADGFEGLPVVATSGNNIALAWLSGPSGVTVRVKSGTPAVWGSPKLVTSAGADGLSIAANGTRFALGWAENAGVKAKIWSAGTWQATRTVASVSETGTYKYVYTTAIALASPSTAGVAFAACRRADCTASATTGVDLRWRESSDNGATWKSAVTLASYASAASRRFNDFPSVLLSSATKRYVMYNTASADFSSYQVWLRVGNG